MPFIPTRKREGISGFRGTNSRQGRSANDPWGLLSLNCEYDQNEVRTRNGTYQLASASTDKWQKALAWKAPGGGSYIITNRLDTNNEIYLLTPSSLPAPLYTFSSSFNYPSFMPWGLRIYIAMVKQQGLAGDNVNWPKYLYDPIGTPAPYMAFRSPMTPDGAAASITDALLYPFGTTVTAGGNVTPGVHRFMVLLESKSGFIGPPSPTTFTSSGGSANTDFSTNVAVSSVGTNRLITINVTPSTVWPADLAYVHLIMTTAANSSRWFRAPGQPQAAPVGTATALTFIVGDSDAIVAQGPDVTQFLSRKYNPYATTGTPIPNAIPFPAIRNIFQCGNRLGWIASSTGTVSPSVPGVYISEDGDPEVISDDFHFISLTGGLDVVQGVCVDGRVFLLGPDWTFITVDTGDFPVTWPTPTPISQTIGTPHPNGISINPYKYALVGHESGLYILRAGGYDERPLSWLQREWWEKIKWPTNSSGDIPSFHILEDTELRLIIVQCITTDYPNGCIYVWDYSDGLRWDRVKFSVWTYTGGVGAIAMPHNLGDSEDAQVRQQLAILPKATGKASLRKRNNSSTPFVDAQGERIDSQYETAYLGQDGDKAVHQYSGLSLNAQGSGNLRITAYGLDNASNFPMRDTALGTSGVKYTRGVRLKSEGCAFLFRNGLNAGDWFRILASPSEPMEVYSRPYSQRKRN